MDKTFGKNGPWKGSQEDICD